MRSGYKKNEKSVISELAEAISSLDLSKVASLLSDTGKFAMQDEHYDIYRSDKERFLVWLNACYKRFRSPGKKQIRLRFTIVQSMVAPATNSILLFEDGHFPLLSHNQLREEKSGLIIKCEEDRVTGIELCYLIMKTEHPFIYERKLLQPVR